MTLEDYQKLPKDWDVIGVVNEDMYWDVENGVDEAVSVSEDVIGAVYLAAIGDVDRAVHRAVVMVVVMAVDRAFKGGFK